jgi:hypothetical protein
VALKGAETLLYQLTCQPEVNCFRARDPRQVSGLNLARTLPGPESERPRPAGVCHDEAKSGPKMKRSYRVDPMTPRLRQISTILAMLDDLSHTRQLIDAELEEVERKKTSQPIQAALMERRAKLQVTIGRLEAGLTSLRNGEDLPM